MFAQFSVFLKEFSVLIQSAINNIFFVLNQSAYKSFINVVVKYITGVNLFHETEINSFRMVLMLFNNSAKWYTIFHNGQFNSLSTVNLTSFLNFSSDNF